MKKALPAIGQTWRIRHSRKGDFTVRILTSPQGDSFDAEIVAGTAKMISHANEDAVPGEEIRLRTALVSFIEQL